MLGRSGEPRKYENARIVRPLRREILHGNEVHAIAQGRDQADLRLAQEAEQGAPAEALVQVADRNPIDVCQLTVYVSGERLESSPDLGILGDRRHGWGARPASGRHD